VAPRAEYARAAAPTREAVRRFGREAEGQHMNEPYSPWHQRNPASEEPLAARYTGSEPILWNGSMVYPMYTDRIGTEPILLYMTLLSQAPPAGLRGHGLGLSVVQGYIELDGHKLTGVDIWSDALARGVTVELVPTAADAVFSLTPVWVDQTGAHRNWTGNYGMLVEDIPNDIVALWCSLGEGPPNFANLVVGVGIAPVRPGTRESSRPAAAETVETPVAAEPPDPGAEPGDWVEHTTDTRSEIPVAAERTSSDTHADSAPVDTSYADSGYADDLLTDTRVPKERQVRRGEALPPAQPTPAFVDENATMTMKYTLPPWGAAPEPRLAPVPPSTPEPRLAPIPTSESVWDSLPRPAHSSESPVASEPAHSSAPDSAFEQFAEPRPEPEPGPAFSSAQASETSEPGAAYRNALYELGTAMYDRGEQEQACGLWAQAAEAGHAAAAHDLAVLLFRRGDHSAAEGWWRVAAGYGEFHSMSLLAELLDRRGDSDEAAQWRTRAAEYAARAGQTLHS